MLDAVGIAGLVTAALGAALVLAGLVLMVRAA
jgi:hypothetical protein